MRMMANTSLQARRPLWSTIAWKTWQGFFKHSAMKAATCLRRQQMTRITGSSGGSWIRKATRWNFGSHRPGNNPHARRGKTGTARLARTLGGLHSRVADASGGASEGASLDGQRHDKPKRFAPNNSLHASGVSN